ncbi:MAG: hypothetical protein ABR550_07170 [Wenzhouxiangellaceae bacterium]
MSGCEIEKTGEIRDAPFLVRVLGDPALFSASVDDEWRLYVGPTFAEQPGTTLNLAITVDDDSGEDTVQIAFPKLLGLDALFVDGFE